MQIQDLMYSPVETVHPDDSAETAWRKMRAAKAHYLVVLDLGEVVGILPEQELGGPEGESQRRNRSVSDLMSPVPVTVTTDMSIRDVINEFRGYSVGCIPVLEDGALVGIVTLADVLEQVSKGLDRGAVKTERRVESGRPIYRRPGHPPIS